MALSFMFLIRGLKVRASSPALDKLKSKYGTTFIFPPRGKQSDLPQIAMKTTARTATEPIPIPT